MIITERIRLIANVIHYNLKIVFGNKFVYFLAAAVIFYLIIIGISLFSDGSPDTGDMYNLLIFPGVLIMFYPVIYNVQNDKDTRILEILFGVPNYRYKVYMVRFGITLLLLFALLCLLAWFAVFAITNIPVFEVVYQLMYPLFFLACLSMLMSTLVRNGNGAAVIMVIIGLVFWFLAEPLSKSKWNIFLNPFQIPNDMNITIWMKVIGQNRLMLMVGAIISVLWGLTNLQRREKFV
jgi:hypothetical protein